MPARPLHKLLALAAATVSVAASAGLAAPVEPVSGRSVSLETPRARAAQAGGQGLPARYPIGGPSLARAADLANSTWGGPPCSGRVEVLWEALDRSVNATATWRNPTDPWNNAPANFDCQIRLNADVYFDWEKLCTVVVHEYGHLMGRQHSPDRRNVMAAYYSEPLPACSGTADPAAAAAEPAPLALPETPASTEPTRAARPRTATRAAVRRAAARRAAVRRRVLRRAAYRRALRRAAARRRAFNGRARTTRTR